MYPSMKSWLVSIIQHYGQWIPSRMPHSKCKYMAQWVASGQQQQQQHSPRLHLKLALSGQTQDSAVLKDGVRAIP